MTTDSTNHVDWVAKLHAGIGWARGRWAEMFFGTTQGLLADWIAEGAREAVRARFPSFAAPDALEEVGIETGLPRLVVESVAQFRARLQNRWPISEQRGTRQGMIAALDSYASISGLISAYHFLEEWEFPTVLWWSRWWVFLLDGEHTIPVSVKPMGSVGCIMGSVTMGGETPQDVVRTLRGLLGTAKRASTIGNVIITDGDAIMGLAVMGSATMGGVEMRVAIP